MIIPQEKFWMEPAEAVAAPAVLFYRNRFRVERGNGAGAPLQRG